MFLHEYLLTSDFTFDMYNMFYEPLHINTCLASLGILVINIFYQYLRL